jgi:dUTP pyrophosphatase
VQHFEDLEVRLERSNLEPVRANPEDAGLDLRSKADVLLPKGKRIMVGTGVQVRIPKGYGGFLIPRSSLSKKHVVLLNSIGLIDSLYRGELLACLSYTGEDEAATIDKDERIVQLVIVPVALPQVLVRYEDDGKWYDTSRGVGGFGSTGSK